MIARFLWIAFLLFATAAADASPRGVTTSNACTRLVFANEEGAPANYNPNYVFTSATGAGLKNICNRFGGVNCTAGTNFFAGDSGLTCTPKLVVWRYCGLGCRPHTDGDNIISTTFVNDSGTVTLSLNGISFTTGKITVTAGETSAAYAAALQAAINAAAPTTATVSATITPASVTFTGGEQVAVLDVTSGLPAGGLPLGGIPCDSPLGSPTLATCTGSGTLPTGFNRIMWPSYATTGTANVWGSSVQASYITLASPPPILVSTSPETIKEFYEVMQITSAMTSGSGIITTNNTLHGTGIPYSGTATDPSTLEVNGFVSTTGVATCESNPSKCGGRKAGYWCDYTVSGGCLNTQWIIGGPASALNTTISTPETITLTPSTIKVSVVSPTSYFSYFDISYNTGANSEPYGGTITWLTDVGGTVAAQGGLTSATAYPNTGWGNASTGSMEPQLGDAATWMNTVVLPQFSAFGSVTHAIGHNCQALSSINYQGGPVFPYQYDVNLASWSLANPGGWPVYLGGGTIPPGGTIGICGGGSMPAIVNFVGVY